MRDRYRMATLYSETTRKLVKTVYDNTAYIKGLAMIMSRTKEPEENDAE